MNRHSRLLFFLMMACATLPSRSRQVHDDTCAVILCAGDLQLTDHLQAFVGSDTNYVFAKWNTVGPFDLFTVNLEHPVTTVTEKVEKEYNFKLLPQFLGTLRTARISAVNAANNHIFDYGWPGIRETIRNLDSAGIPYFGIGSTIAQARHPLIFTVRGIRIAFLGYAGGGNFAASERRAGRAPMNESWILEDVRRARESADLVVVNLHWGEERADTPSVEQRRLAHNIIRGGADVIVGHHPHVLQGIERYRQGVIAYSMGNFVFGASSTARNDRTAVLRLTVCRNGWSASVVPIIIRDWQPQAADSVSASRVRRQLRERSKIFKQTLEDISE